MVNYRRKVLAGQLFPLIIQGIARNAKCIQKKTKSQRYSSKSSKSSKSRSSCNCCCGNLPVCPLSTVAQYPTNAKCNSNIDCVSICISKCNSQQGTCILDAFSNSGNCQCCCPSCNREPPAGDNFQCDICQDICLITCPQNVNVQCSGDTCQTCCCAPGTPVCTDADGNFGEILESGDCLTECPTICGGFQFPVGTTGCIALPSFPGFSACVCCTSPRQLAEQKRRPWPKSRSEMLQRIAELGK